MGVFDFGIRKVMAAKIPEVIAKAGLAPIPPQTATLNRWQKSASFVPYGANDFGGPGGLPAPTVVQPPNVLPSSITQPGNDGSPQGSTIAGVPTSYVLLGGGALFLLLGGMAMFSHKR